VVVLNSTWIKNGFHVIICTLITLGRYILRYISRNLLRLFKIYLCLIFGL